MSTTDFISIDNARLCDCKKGNLSCIEARDWMKNQIGVWQFMYEPRDIRDKSVHPAVFPIAIASIYGEITKDSDGKWRTSGESRTGCMFCAFGEHLEPQPNKFQRMQITHPKQWEYCMKPVDQGGLGLSIPLDYIGCPWKNEEPTKGKSTA